MLLSQLISNTNCITEKYDDTEISSLCYDSRKAKEGSLFVCLVGTAVDGHDYIDAAYKNGCRFFAVSKEIEKKDGAVYLRYEDTRKALALLSANFFDRPADKIFTVGITGTKGKTSISFMIRSIFEEMGKKVGIIGTTGIIYGDVFEKSDNSTPESYEIHRHLAEMVKQNVDICVMEVSSQGLMMHRSYGIMFDAAIFTNLSPDHIGEGEHKSFEEYRDCKSILFSQCTDAFANMDDDNFMYVTAPFGRRPTMYSATRKSDFYADEIKFESDEKGLKTSYMLHSPYGEFPVTLNIPGKFTVYNSLAAAACAMTFGAEPEQVREGLYKAFVEGRMQKVNTGLPFTVLMDYAHNALSMQSLYETVSLYPHGKIITVFGCGGNRAKARRYDMGSIAAKYSALSVICSDNPRFEKLDDIIEDILVGTKKGLEENKGGEYAVIKDRKEAIEYALSKAKKGDIVIIPGKGHQHYEEIEGKKIPFNEKEIVENYAKRTVGK